MIDTFDKEHRFLSNFYPCSVTLDDIEYASVEHAYQAAKTLDLEARKFIAAAKHAGEAKKLGKHIILRNDWIEVRLSIMRDLLKQKFKDPALKQKLLDTQPHDLIEGNWWGDRFWGCVKIEGKWEGENNLGRLLMQIRDD